MSKQKQLTQLPMDIYNDLMAKGQVQLGEPVSLVDIKDVQAGQWFEYHGFIFMRMNHCYDFQAGLIEKYACIDLGGEIRYLNGRCQLIERWRISFATM